MSIDKITPTDSRVDRSTIEIHGQRWSYLDATPAGQQRGVVVLVHGFPDLSLAWRYQIPMLTDLGFRCIALDCAGYGETGAPSDLHTYGFKSHADAVAGIAEHIGARRIVLGGHDWGGAAVYRIAQWYPQLVSHVFSVCTPFFKVSDTFVSTEDVIKAGVKQFGYQLQFGSSDEKVEKVVNSEERVRKFLLGLYGGRPKSGKAFMTAEEGIDLSLIEDDDIGMTPLLNDEELEFYVKQFTKNGVHGPCNWYRTRQVNFDDEKYLPSDQRKQVQQPTLYVFATNDFILTEDLTRGMEKSIPNLSKGDVPTGHWALWEKPKETNEVIKKWMEAVVIGGKSRL